MQTVAIRLIFYELKTKFNQNLYFKNVSTFFSLQLYLYDHTDPQLFAGHSELSFFNI